MLKSTVGGLFKEHASTWFQLRSWTAHISDAAKAVLCKLRVSSSPLSPPMIKAGRQLCGSSQKSGIAMMTDAGPWEGAGCAASEHAS